MRVDIKLWIEPSSSIPHILLFGSLRLSLVLNVCLVGAVEMLVDGICPRHP